MILNRNHLRLLLEIDADQQKIFDKLSATRMKLFMELQASGLAIGVGNFCRLTSEGENVIALTLGQFNRFAIGDGTEKSNG